MKHICTLREDITEKKKKKRSLNGKKINSMLDGGLISMLTDV